jgi:hypothetical protein
VLATVTDAWVVTTDGLSRPRLAVVALVLTVLWSLSSCAGAPSAVHVSLVASSMKRVRYGDVSLEVPSSWPVVVERSACKAYGRSAVFVEEPVPEDAPICDDVRSPAFAVRLGPLHRMPAGLPLAPSSRDSGTPIYVDGDGPVPHSFFLIIPRAHVQILVTCGTTRSNVHDVVDSIRLVD